MSERVLEAVIEALKRRGGVSAASPDRITVGESAILVELEIDNDHDAGGERRRIAGLAHRPDGAAASVTAHDVETLLSPIREDTRSIPSGTPAANDYIRRATAVGTLNALSSPYMEWQTGDPMALLASTVETIVTVGLFRPAFRKFSDVEVRIIEREPLDPGETPDDVTVKQFQPADADVAMRDADVVFVTGSTLVYGGLERYLKSAPASATLVVIGATASFLPEPLFDRGVDIVAGATVTDPGRVRDAVRDGACGTGLHDRGVEKMYTANEATADIHLQ